MSAEMLKCQVKCKAEGKSAMLPWQRHLAKMLIIKYFNYIKKTPPDFSGVFDINYNL
jgi:hypothetical protein